MSSRVCWGIWLTSWFSSVLNQAVENPTCAEIRDVLTAAGANVLVEVMRHYINNELHSYIWCFTGTQNALHRRGMPHSLPLCSSHLSNSTTAIFHRQPRHHRLGVLPDYKSLIVVQLTNHRTRCTLESGTETWRSEEEYVFSWSRRMELSAQTSLHHVSVCEGEEQHPMAQISQTGRNTVCFHHQMVSQHTVVCVCDHSNKYECFAFLLIVPKGKDVMIYCAEMIPKLKTRTQKGAGADSGSQQGEGSKKSKKKRK